jgi:amidase
MTHPWSGAPVNEQMIEGAELAARLCESLGHEIEVCAPALDYEAFIEATHTIWVTCVHHFVKSVANQTGRLPSLDNLEATTFACFKEGGEIRASALQAAFSTANEVTRSFAQFFLGHDILITPTIATPAPPLGTLNANDSTLSARQWTERIFTFAPFTAVFNMTGQPALSLPIHRTQSGLPVGIQFVGRPGAEHTLLQLGRQLEQIAPWPTVAPLWSSQRSVD